jgi:hypothetical protein
LSWSFPDDSTSANLQVEGLDGVLGTHRAWTGGFGTHRWGSSEAGDSVPTKPRKRGGQPMPGVYYTKTEEEHPVFHTSLACSEGNKIDDKNREWAVLTRDHCKECIALAKAAR